MKSKCIFEQRVQERLRSVERITIEHAGYENPKETQLYLLSKGANKFALVRDVFSANKEKQHEKRQVWSRRQCKE